MKNPRPALVVLWTSVGVIIAVLIVLGAYQWRMSSEGVVESVGSRPAFSPSVSATPTPSLSPSAAPNPSASPSETRQAYAVPMSLRIPSLDIQTRILPVALDENRAIEIPEDIGKVGWYRLGVPPGAYRGSAVLVGHRDGKVQGHGVFYNLGNMDVGDKVVVTDASGNDLDYRVVARESILKKKLPYEEIFSVDGDPRLTLISCGGFYDRNNGGYQDNVVVTAVPEFEAVGPSEAPTETPIASAPVESGTVIVNPPVQEGTISEPLLLDDGS